MNKRQKWVLTNFAFLVLITAVSVAGMVELKNWVNRSESVRAMEQLQISVFTYKQKNGSLPPESYIEVIRKSLAGEPRLGDLNYRARWIKFDSPPETILAYVRKGSRSFLFNPGAIVLRLDGRIEWMDKATFDELIVSQQTPLELEITPKEKL
jgi:hypothetical protein